MRGASRVDSARGSRKGPFEGLATVTIASGTLGVNLADQSPPRLIRGLDVRALPLSPEEAFVLSRVDGMAPPKEIAASTGLPDERVVVCLERLRSLGAISFGPTEVAPPPRPTAGVRPVPQATASTSGTPTATPASPAGTPASPAGTPPSPAPPPPQGVVARTRLRAVEEHTPSTPLHPAARDYDLAELEEPADLEPERKKLILDTFYALARLNHYQLLDVPEDADKKAIKLAYYERVAVFHTDRYYGKNLGAFKARLEKVFGALTKAYDTLTRNKSREEYDRYLVTRRRSAGVDSAPPRRMTPMPVGSPDMTPAPAPAIEAPAPGGASAPASGGTSSPPTTPYIPPPPRPPVVGAVIRGLGPSPAAMAQAARAKEDAAQTTGNSPSTLPPGDAEAARRALARKLMGTRGSVPPSAPTPSEDEKRTSANDGLKNLYEKRLNDGAAQAAARYRELAEQAISEGNLASAINTLKIALSAAPDDKSLVALLDQVEERSDAAMADQFLEQARYEEQDGHFAQAARAYGRAARGKKSAQLYDRAALCLVEAGIEARQAVEFARKATALDPKRAVYRLTLARAYYLGNMPTSGSAELKRALELAPDHEDIKAWAKRLK